MKICMPVLLSFLVSGCITSQAHREESTSHMANPASQHCQAVGGKSEIVKTATGEVGYCTLPSGEHSEEWALYRRDKG